MFLKSDMSDQTQIIRMRFNGEYLTGYKDPLLCACGDWLTCAVEVLRKQTRRLTKSRI